MFFRLKVSVIIEKIKKKSLTTIQLKKIKELLLEYDIIYRTETDLLKITDGNKAVLDELAAYVELSFTDYLAEHKPYLTTEQIESLVKQGFEIGSHSFSHTYYPSICEDEQVEETLSSMEWLRLNFAVKEKLFAFPYTDFQIKKTFFQRIENEIDLSFGTANLKLDSIKNNFQRIPMEIVGRATAERIVKSEYIYFIVKKILDKHIIKRD